MKSSTKMSTSYHLCLYETEKKKKEVLSESKKEQDYPGYLNIWDGSKVDSQYKSIDFKKIKPQSQVTIATALTA